ncbi:MAG: DNA adenine methylase [Treponema sp.]|nr:DNA adenine methylase [Treponema sp.]
MIQSPLNYMGGKFKLLPQILPMFPKRIDHFFDIFCGGCNVGINVECKEITFIDRDAHLIYLYQTFQNLDRDEIFKWIYNIIAEYGLSLVSKNGYQFYNCNSSKGLGAYNKEPFTKLRADFNNCKIFDYRYYVMMYVIIVYAFNNQIRFNSSGEFNLPVGKRDFNSRMHSKLLAFIDKLQSNACQFICQDFRNFDIEQLSENDFVYVDPPYLITCATYNENGGWTNSDELDLLKFLDSIQSRKIKFALSNVLKSNGKENLFLMEWLNKNSNFYHAIHLNNSYANSNYHKIDKFSENDEVLIVNY